LRLNDYDGTQGPSLNPTAETTNSFTKAHQQILKENFDFSTTVGWFEWLAHRDSSIDKNDLILYLCQIKYLKISICQTFEC